MAINSSKSNSLEKIYTLQEFAHYLGVGVKKVRHMLMAGELRHQHSGNHWWIPESAIQEWLNQQHNKDNEEQESESVITKGKKL